MEQLNKTQFIVSIINELFPNDFSMGHYIEWSSSTQKLLSAKLRGEGSRCYCCLAAKCFAANWLCSAQAFCDAARRILPTAPSSPLWKGSRVSVLSTMQNAVLMWWILLAGKAPVFSVFCCTAVSWSQYFQWQQQAYVVCQCHRLCPALVALLHTAVCLIKV